MKNRIDQMLERAEKQQKKVLIPFLTAGDPSLAVTEELILKLEQEGAEAIELGIPFTDPMAEGPDVQAANLRALANGDVSVGHLMEWVGQLREKTQIPLIYWVYYNSLLHYGLERFFEDCSNKGVDGVIIPDLPFEELDEIADFAEKYEIYPISLAAPMERDRLEKVCAQAKGFLYCMPAGVHEASEEAYKSFFEQVRAVSKIPTCVGVGILTPEQAQRAAQYSDGVVVDNAFVCEMATASEKTEKIERSVTLIRKFREALD